MKLISQRIATWCGPAFALLFATGFWGFAHFVPPPSPDDSAAQVAAMFQTNRDGIRFGMQLAMFAAALYFPFCAALTQQIRRVEGPDSPWAMTQLIAGAGSVMIFVFSFMNIQAAGYREQRSPEEIRLAADMGWLPFLGIFSIPTIQLLAVGIAILQDRSPQPIFPRWSGYLNVWVALLLVPAFMLVFFKTGPLAWNGLFTWWIPAGAFFGWLMVMTALMLRALSTQEQNLATATVNQAVVA